MSSVGPLLIVTKVLGQKLLMGFKTQNDSERPCRDNGVMKLKVTCYNHKQQNLALNHLKWFTDS